MAVIMGVFAWGGRVAARVLRGAADVVEGLVGLIDSGVAASGEPPAGTWAEPDDGEGDDPFERFRASATARGAADSFGGEAVAARSSRDETERDEDLDETEEEADLEADSGDELLDRSVDAGDEEEDEDEDENAEDDGDLGDLAERDAIAVDADDEEREGLASADADDEERESPPAGGRLEPDGLDRTTTDRGETTADAAGAVEGREVEPAAAAVEVGEAEAVPADESSPGPREEIRKDRSFDTATEAPAGLPDGLDREDLRSGLDGSPAPRWPAAPRGDESPGPRETAADDRFEPLPRPGGASSFGEAFRSRGSLVPESPRGKLGPPDAESTPRPGTRERIAAALEAARSTFESSRARRALGAPTPTAAPATGSADRPAPAKVKAKGKGKSKKLRRLDPTPGEALAPSRGKKAKSKRKDERARTKKVKNESREVLAAAPERAPKKDEAAKSRSKVKPAGKGKPAGKSGRKK